MSPHIADLAILDELLLGMADEDDLTTWRALVREPGGAATWQAALARRMQLDRTARLSAHPWLAQTMLALRRAGRRIKSMPTFVPTAAFPPVPVLDAVLDHTNETTHTIVQLAWGHVVELAVPVGEVVALHHPVDVPASIYYQSAKIQGQLMPGHNWRLEPDEAPVLLMLAIDSPGATDMLSVLGSASACAAVVLSEAVPT